MDDLNDFLKKARREEQLENVRETLEESKTVAALLTGFITLSFIGVWLLNDYIVPYFGWTVSYMFALLFISILWAFFYILDRILGFFIRPFMSLCARGYDLVLRVRN